MKKTRIQRVAAGEKILVEPIAEDLQDQHETMLDLKDKMIEAVEAMVQGHKDGLHFPSCGCANVNQTTEQFDKVNALMRDTDLAKSAYEIAVINFWLKIKERYTVYGRILGIRDGYALVEIDPKEQIKKIIIDGGIEL